MVALTFPCGIGHRGAAALAPENALAAMRAAIGAGVDMVEFDVVPGPVVGHDGDPPVPALRRSSPSFREIAPPELGFLVDLKGARPRARDARGVRGRRPRRQVRVPTGELRSLAALNGRARTSATITPGGSGSLGRSHRPMSMPAPAPATPRSDTTSSRPRPSPPSTAKAAGASTWTVNTRDGLSGCAAGCDGVITDDPRLFHEE